MEVYLHSFIYIHSVVPVLRTCTRLNIMLFKHTNNYNLPQIVIFHVSNISFHVTVVDYVFSGKPVNLYSEDPRLGRDNG